MFDESNNIHKTQIPQQIFALHKCSTNGTEDELGMMSLKIAYSRVMALVLFTVSIHAHVLTLVHPNIFDPSNISEARNTPLIDRTIFHDSSHGKC